MSKSPIGHALSALNTIAGSELLHKYGLYQPATKVVYHASRNGFRAATALVRQFKAVEKRDSAERLPAPEKKKDLFDLNISDEQQSIREMAQRFAKELMRAAAPKANDACKAPEGFAAQFAELGLAQFAVPESLGGAAAESSTVTQALVAEDLAWGDMGLALAALAPIGVANALARWGSAEQQSRYLQPFAGENPPVAALAITEARPAFEPRELRTRVRQDGSGFALSGEKTAVPLAESAEFFLVAADLLGKGPQLFIVEANTPGVTVRAEPSMGVRASTLGTVRFEEVRLTHDALLGGAPGAVDYEEVLSRCSIGACALAVGTCQAILDYVIPYCNDRKAFGEPISNRQAVAFMIADIAIELAGMRLLTWRAASRAEQGLPFQREAYLARVLCSEKGMKIGTDGVQLLGGHGFTKEHPVERWYRDLRAISLLENGLLV
ncbi:MAG TPA: acyl-CoA dehydrogenase family protein [Polyangiaceae bacterium]|nr:acyl-CoA dehydrogenase family protein [Polyangiaceae bacterium]